MKLVILAAFAVCSLSFAGPSLSSMKKGIENDIGKISSELEGIAKRCADLNEDLEEYNNRTGAMSQEIMAKRAELAYLSEKYYSAIEIFDASQMAYNSLLGTLEATKLTLELFRVQNLEALKDKLALTKAELKAAVAALRVGERKLLDPSAYATDEERSSAEMKIIELKVRVAYLASRKVAIEENMTMVDPGEIPLRNKIAVVQDKVNYHAEIIKTYNTIITANLAAQVKLAVELNKAEVKVGSFKRIELPKICR